MQYLCIVHVHMHPYALCGYTRTCRYVAIQVNRPSGISQAAAVAGNRTKGVKPPQATQIIIDYFLGKPFRILNESL